MEKSKKIDADGKPRPARTVLARPSVLYSRDVDGRLRNSPGGVSRPSRLTQKMGKLH